MFFFTWCHGWCLVQDPDQQLYFNRQVDGLESPLSPSHFQFLHSASELILFMSQADAAAT